MNAPPLITIFVRHSADCKYAGDEFCKRCSCRKHLRWTQGGKQYRRKAGTRSWQEAEEQKRRLEDQLAGRTPTTTKVNAGQPIDAAVKLFLQDKTTQGLSSGVLDKYSRGKTGIVYGYRLSGMSEGGAYGDDYQPSTNYALVRVTNNATGHVFYCRTHNPSSYLVQNSALEYTKFDVPAGAETGPSMLVAVTNGIPSQPISVTVH